MEFLKPPSWRSVRVNIRLLLAEWRAAEPAARYFIASHLLSAVLLGLSSLAALAAGFAGLPLIYFGLLAAAALCAAQAAATWTVLKRRFRVRFEAF